MIIGRLQQSKGWAVLFCCLYLMLSFNVFVQAPQVSLKCTDTDCSCHLAPADAPCCCMTETEQQRAAQSRPDAVPLARLFGEAKCQGPQSNAFGILLTHGLHVPVANVGLSPKFPLLSLLLNEEPLGWDIDLGQPDKVPIIPV